MGRTGRYYAILRNFSYYFYNTGNMFALGKPIIQTFINESLHMTLKEIAKEAGVAPSTVSRILNNKGHLAASQETQDRVWAIVHRLGYVPNNAAKKLRTGEDVKPGNATAIACLYARSGRSMDSPFFLDIARGIEIEAFSHNCFMRYSLTTGDLSTLQNFAESPAGIAVLGRCNKRILHDLKGIIPSVIYAGLNNIDADYDQVISDGKDASYKVMDYLIGVGHEHIAYIGETSEEIRYIGYRDKLIERRIPFRPEYVVDRLLSADGGYSGMMLLMESAPQVTAVFCANDQTAIGAVKAAQVMGLRIPEDISIASIDDIEMAKYMSPPLTTVHIPTAEIGSVAAKILIDRIQGGHKLPMKISLPSKLIIRESCATPRSKSISVR